MFSKAFPAVLLLTLWAAHPAIALAQALTTPLVVTRVGQEVGDGGAATNAILSPQDVAWMADGSVLISDYGTSRIRIVRPSGVIETVAGTGYAGYSGDGGPATQAQLSGPTSVTSDSAGNVYVADTGNHRIRRIAAGTGIITTIASSEMEPGLANVRALISDAAGNLYAGSFNGGRIYRIAAGTATLTSYAGNGTGTFTGEGVPAAAAGFGVIFGLALGPDGSLFVAADERVRRIDSQSTIIQTVAGGGSTFIGHGDNQAYPATQVALGFTFDLAVTADGRLCIAAASGARIFSLSGGTLQAAAGTGLLSHGGDGGPALEAFIHTATGISALPDGSFVIASGLADRVRRFTPGGTITTFAGGGSRQTGDGGHASRARTQARDLAFDTKGNLFLADGNRIRRIDTSGIITTVAGGQDGAPDGDGGPALNARLGTTSSVAIDASGNIYLTAFGLDRVRRVDSSSGVITTFAGGGAVDADNVPATAVRLSTPGPLATDHAGNVYVADGSRIRRIGVDGNITTVATLSSLIDIDVDARGRLYAAFRASVRPSPPHDRVVRIDPGTGEATILAGTAPPAPPQSGEGVPATSVTLQITSIAVAANDDLYIAAGNLRRVTAADGLIRSVDPVSYQDAPPRLDFIHAVDVGAAGNIYVAQDYRPHAATSFSIGMIREVRLFASSVIAVDRSSLRFGARASGSGPITSVTPPQTVTVSMTAPAATWTARSDQPWLIVSNASGSGAGSFAVSISDTGLNSLMSATGTITVGAGAEVETKTIAVTLTIDRSSAAAAPFGQVDTPSQNAAGIVGAIGVTGWAMDDVGVASVKVYRNCLAFEPQVNCQVIGGQAVVFIGDAAFLPGARPDVEQAFQGSPQS